MKNASTASTMKTRKTIFARPTGGAGESAEAEHGGDEGDDEEGDGQVNHNDSWLQVSYL